MDNEGKFQPEITKELEKQETVAKKLETIFGDVTVIGISHNPATMYESSPWNEANLEKRRQVGRENAAIIEGINDVLKTEVLPKSYETHERSTAYAHKKHQTDLFYLGSILLQRGLDKEKIGSDLREAFNGKKVLILGDDIGTLSETINRLGGNAVGIEYDSDLVDVAHSGKYAEDGEPQNQVMQGDIYDLTDENSALFKKLKELGQFDIIYSHAVFNTGSGIDNSDRAYADKTKARELSLLGAVLNNTDNLLNERGFQVHTSTEFGSYGIFDIDTRIDEEKAKPALIENGGPVLIWTNDKNRPRESFIARKGLVKQLVEAEPFR